MICQGDRYILFDGYYERANLDLNNKLSLIGTTMPLPIGLPGDEVARAGLEPAPL